MKEIKLNLVFFFSFCTHNKQKRRLPIIIILYLLDEGKKNKVNTHTQLKKQKTEHKQVNISNRNTNRE